MTLNLEKPKLLPPRIFIYGPHKMGKSTFGALSNNPVFIQTEDGLTNINVPRFPLARNFTEVLDSLKEIGEEKHDFKTLVIDTADWLEPLIHQHVAFKAQKESIEDIGYGKGYVQAMDLWRDYTSALNYIRDTRNMTIIQIAHAEIRRFDNPETDSYDVYQPKLHKLASAHLMEHSDAIFFVNQYVGVTKEAAKFQKEGRKRAVGSGERILYTQERPAFKAGNRYDLPESIPFDREGKYWSVIAQHIPFFNTEEKGN